MKINCSAGKGILELEECLACALSGDNTCGYDYALIKSMMNDEKKESRRSEIHVTDLTGCLRKAWYDKVSPQPEYIHETLARWLGVNFHHAAEGSDAVLESELPLEYNGIVGTADIVYRDGRVVDNKFCQPAGEIVQMADGTHKRIEEIKIFDEVLAWTKEGFKPERVMAVMDGGVQEVFELTLSSGQTIRASGNHPILTDRGFVQMKDLDPGWDRVQVLTKWTAGEKMDLDDARMLGYFTGDGNTTPEYSTNIACAEMELREDIQAICKAHGWGATTTIYGGKFHYLRIHNAGKRMSATGPVKFLKQYGIHQKYAWEKTVPDAVMKGDEKVISEFLAGYFDTDGTITDPDGPVPPRVSICTTSGELARQVADLCRRVNIYCRVYSYPSTYMGRKYRPVYLINVWQAGNILRFGYRVPFRAKKKRERFIKWIPRLEKTRQKGGKHLRRVESVTSLGEMQTIGLEIENSHTYISNGIITHNTRWIFPQKLPYGSHSTQVNLYAHMLRKMGREVKQLQVQYVDASGPTKCRKCRVPVRAIDGELRCPNCGNVIANAHLGAVLVDIPIWPDEEVEAYITERKENLLGALELGLPPEKEPGFLCAYCSHAEVCQPGEYE